MERLGLLHRRITYKKAEDGKLWHLQEAYGIYEALKTSSCFCGFVLCTVTSLFPKTVPVTVDNKCEKIRWKEIIGNLKVDESGPDTLEAMILKSF